MFGRKERNGDFHSTITDKPTMRRIKQEIRFGYIEGHVNLSCEADAEPQPEFVWYREGKKLYHNVTKERHSSVLQVGD